jgi:L-ornithine Nalpha-acyltransferase
VLPKGNGEIQHGTMELIPRPQLFARLAVKSADLRAAQRLRYMVFAEECGARLSPEGASDRRDSDRFDAICEHLLVIDPLMPETSDGTTLSDGRLVGTYRLLRQGVAENNFGFYSAAEFDISPLFERHPGLRFLEVGRSCVAASHRGKAVAELLWQGIWDYVRANNLDVMMGCASLPGTNPQTLANELSFLHHLARATDEWNVQALPHRHQNMNLLPEASIDKRMIARNLPTLIKAYLRLGAFVGESAVIDHAFNTTDVLIILPVSRINPKYFSHYGAPV